MFSNIHSDEKQERFCMEGQIQRKRLKLINTLLCLLTVITLLLAYKTYTLLSEYYEAAREYRELQNLAITEDEAKDEEMSIQVDFNKLFNINPEIVAWIRFEEPAVINYPIVQGEDNRKYLTSTFEGTENGVGCIYMDADNAGDFSDRNTFIYGHYKKNGHMFGALGKYKDIHYYKQYPYFEIYTPNGECNQYQIFAVTIVDSTSDSYRKVYVNDIEYWNYLEMIKKLSLYETGVEVKEDSQIVSLSTCTNVRIEERLLIHGVKVNTVHTK